MARHFTGLANWNSPEGGLFFWLCFTSPTSTRDILQEALAKGVAFMPGDPFFPNPEDGVGFMRLNFSNPPLDSITYGLKILSEII